MACEIALAAAEVKKQRGGSYGWTVSLRSGGPRESLSLSLRPGADTNRVDVGSVAMQGPPTVTVVHKSNVLSITDGLFRESVRAVAKEYPQVEVNEQIVDSLVYRCVFPCGPLRA